jgi:hypothetical protein
MKKSSSTSLVVGKKTRIYDPLKDTRRFSDGVRLHEWVGMVLVNGWDDLHCRSYNCDVSQSEFSRSAIPVLARLQLIVLIDPNDPLPDWLSHRDRKLANRGGKLPIWMPDCEAHKDKKSLAAREVRINCRRDFLVITEAPEKKAEQETLH